MNKLIDQLIVQNKKEIAMYQDGFLLTPATNLQISSLNMAAQNLFNESLSSEYIELLKLSNGFSINGLNIYGTNTLDGAVYIPNLIEANNAFYELDSLKQYISYADENMSRLVYDRTMKAFLIVDRVTWEKLSEHQTFNEALSELIQTNYIFE